MILQDAESIIKQINDCLLPKLSKNYDESESHIEVDAHNSCLEKKIFTLIEELEKYSLKLPNDGLDKDKDNDEVDANEEDLINIISSLINLYKELLCDCSLNAENATESAMKLDECFTGIFKIKLEDVLRENELCDSQVVFDRLLDELCKKLTSEDFKKYPGQVEVYFDLVENIKDFDVTVNSIKILPVALILMDDYIESNQTKGLLCCEVLLKNMTDKDFMNGNYYDVIYLSIKNVLNNKDLKITELSQACALELCQIFPSDVKDEMLDEMYSAALDHLNTESNLYRKASFFQYTKNIIEMHQVKCIGNSLFKTIICDTIENCLTNTVAEILLIPALECLEEWIKYCWPVWNLTVDSRMLCVLLKYYSHCDIGEAQMLAQQLIVILVSLCNLEEQKQFVTLLTGRSGVEITKLNGLKKDIGVSTENSIN